MKTICDKCGSLHDGSYGSGRFCSSKCARGFSTDEKRILINEKISKSLSKPGEEKICLVCDKKFITKRKTTFCSKQCSSKSRKMTPDGISPVVSFRQRMKIKAIAYKGGKCIICGYSKCIRSLQFHHKNASDKEFGIGGKSYSWDKLKIELDKCDLVCANCHGEIHDIGIGFESHPVSIIGE